MDVCLATLHPLEQYFCGEEWAHLITNLVEWELLFSALYNTPCSQNAMPQVI